jgi:hypothetical protein
MSEGKNSVVVSLLNVCSTIEQKIREGIAKETKILGSDEVKRETIEGSEAIVFSDITVPEVLKNDMVAWLMLINLKGDEVISDKYLLSINLRNRKTGEAYLAFESETTEETWKTTNELVKKVYKK